MAFGALVGPSAVALPAPQLIGTTSAAQQITLTNVGTAPVTVGPITVFPAGEFLAARPCLSYHFHTTGMHTAGLRHID
jgi:hypothetical protein